MSTKALRRTGMTDGHSHTYDDAMSGGMTSPPEDDPNGHRHRWVMDEDGNIVIFESEGHTHSAGRRVNQNSGEAMLEAEQKKVTVPLQIKRLDDEDPDFFQFEGYAATFGNIDLGNDIIERGAFARTIDDLRKRARPIPGRPEMRSLMKVLWQHAWDSPIGSFVEMQEDDKGLFVKGMLPKNDSLVAGRVMPQMQAGAVSDMSIGYIATKRRFEEDIRVIEEAELFATALVTIPMNPEAQVTGIKAVVPFQDLPLASRERPWDRDAAEGRVREATGSMEDPSESFRRAFLWYDASAPENFGSYKLPVADVIDGRLMAVPRAIFAAASVLRGGRGGVDIPDSDRTGVVRNVERYYEKMGLDSPFQEARSVFRIDDVNALTERQLESLIKDGLLYIPDVSGTKAKAIVSAVKSIMSRDETRRPQKRSLKISSRALRAYKTAWMPWRRVLLSRPMSLTRTTSRRPVMRPKMLSSSSTP